MGVATKPVVGDSRPSEAGPAGADPAAAHSSPADAPMELAAERIDLGEPPAPLAASDTFAAAGRKAMWPHVDRMLEREPEIRNPALVDSLRKYRVAMRRLRAAMRLFREAYPTRQLRPLREGLGELAREVGAVRDLDVRIADLDGWARESGANADAQVAPLRAAWVDQRRVGAAALEHRLATKRHRRLLERLAEFVTSTEAGEGAIEPAGAWTVRDRVASSTWLAYERLRALAPAADGATPEALHAIRIEAKRLRYTLEFLGPVMGAQHEWLIARLVAVQDHLGQLNDAAVNAAAIRAFSADRGATLSPAERSTIEAYLEAREQAVERLLRSFGRVWRPVAGATFAGRLGGAVVVVEAG